MFIRTSISGVGAVKKKFATSMNPKLKMTFDGDVITAKIKAGPKTNKASFKLGEEYDVETEFGASKVQLYIVNQMLLCNSVHTFIESAVKPVLSGHSKIDKTMILMKNGSLMKVESIAECSP